MHKTVVVVVVVVVVVMKEVTPSAKAGINGEPCQWGTVTLGT